MPPVTMFESDPTLANCLSEGLHPNSYHASLHVAPAQQQLYTHKLEVACISPGPSADNLLEGSKP